MFGLPMTAMYCLNRRPLLKPKCKTLRYLNLRTVMTVCAVFICALWVNPAFGQATTTNGPVRITLDEAIQLAIQHNHFLIAMRTTIQQSEAEEVTQGLRPNPSLFVDWEYLPLFGSPANQ